VQWRLAWEYHVGVRAGKAQAQRQVTVSRPSHRGQTVSQDERGGCIQAFDVTGLRYGRECTAAHPGGAAGRGRVTVKNRGQNEPKGRRLAAAVVLTTGRVVR
jgi:hypothetical protein